VPETDLRFIGFLDIFGFENFQYDTLDPNPKPDADPDADPTPEPEP